jgi:hypothetical protein
MADGLKFYVASIGVSWHFTLSEAKCSVYLQNK